MGRSRLSKRQVVDWLEMCGGVQMSPGSVVNMQEVVSQALAEAVAELQRYVQDQPACNIDQTRSAWLWTVVTPLASYFEFALSRSGEVARRLLAHCQGIVGSDRHRVITGCHPPSARCVGAICCVIFRRSWNAMPSRSRLATTYNYRQTTSWRCELRSAREPCHAPHLTRSSRLSRPTSSIG
jgi:hypothetical protein